jgi:hypothetical protein
LLDRACSFPLSRLAKTSTINHIFGEANLKKTIVAITAAAFLGGTAVTMTPAPAHALYPIFLALAKPDPNFKSVNPYAKKPAKHMKKAKAKKKM